MRPAKDDIVARAKAVRISQRTPIPITDDSVKLALAWMRDEVRLVQISALLFPETQLTNNSTKIYLMLARALREAHRRGLLIEKGER